MQIVLISSADAVSLLHPADFSSSSTRAFLSSQIVRRPSVVFNHLDGVLELRHVVCVRFVYPLDFVRVESAFRVVEELAISCLVFTFFSRGFYVKKLKHNNLQLARAERSSHVLECS